MLRQQSINGRRQGALNAGFERKDSMALDEAAQVRAISRFLTAQGIREDFIKWAEMDAPLFHYTDYNAFANIVTGKDLWLTDAGFSNDADELEDGRKIIKEELEQQSGDAAKPAHQLAKDIIELEKKAKEPKDLPEAVYICCFCEDGDLLSQWRGYAANGGGVAIEIDPIAFRSVGGVTNPEGIMRFWKVSYGESDKLQWVRRALDFWAGEPDPDPPDSRAEDAAVTLRFLVPIFKHERFKDENECRLIFTPAPTFKKPSFRVSRGLLAPYLKMSDIAGEVPPATSNLGWFVIKSVRIGPGPYAAVNAASSKRLLASYGFPGAEIKRSVIPFRG
jgi:hypothetical protein